MPYSFWIPASIAIYAFQAWLAVKANHTGGKWHWILFVVCMFTLWPFIAKHSKHLLFDAILFDSILVVSYTAALILFSHSKLNSYQWGAIGLVISGLILFKKFSG